MIVSRLYRVIAVSLFLAAFLPAPQTPAEEGHNSPTTGDLFAAQPALRQATLTGYTRARHVMDLVSEEAGRCVGVTADVGDPIGEDGIFATLDTTFIDLAIKKNRVAQERLANMIAYHAKEVKRFEELVERETAAQSKLDTFQNQLDQAEFEIQALKIEENELKERRTRHLIKVPPGWTIVERAVEPGEWVSIGERVGRAGDFLTLLVPFSLSPGEYSTLKELKRTVELFLPDVGQTGLAIKGFVERISPAFDPETRKINVDLAVAEGVPEKRGGLRVQLTFRLPDPSGAVLVPTSALNERYEEYWLTRASGEHVRVVLLGDGPPGTSRVRSPEVRPGDKFKVRPSREP